MILLMFYVVCCLLKVSQRYITGTIFDDALKSLLVFQTQVKLARFRFAFHLYNFFQVKNDFMKKLSEIPDLNNSASWDNVKSRMSLDPQCEALFSDSHRQNWFREYFEILSDVSL